MNHVHNVGLVGPIKYALTIGIISILYTGAVYPQLAVSGSDGTTASLDPAKNMFRIGFTQPKWEFTGTIEGVVTNARKGSGRDKIGVYEELTFNFTKGERFRGSMRVYGGKPVVLFTCTFIDPVDSHPPFFPALSGIPENLGMLTYSEHEFGAPPVLHTYPGKDGGERHHSGPIVLFDKSANACIISPASEFMIGDIVENPSGLRCGLNPGIHNLPAGFSYRVIMAAAAGINRTWDVWGHALTDFHGKRRPSNKADVSLQYLGYWTDNGATYYYHYDTSKGYEGTLVALKRRYDSLHIPIHYIQLDSWWYGKGYDNPDGTYAQEKKRIPELPEGSWNRFGGLLQYEPPKDLFPDGLRGFHDSTGLPLMTHNRWISRESPYRSDYEISGIGATDPRWWDTIIRRISSWGVRIYEQDWLDRIYKYSTEFSTTTTAGKAFMDGMAAACKRNILTMQYCMALPRHYLQGGAHYTNLTSIRVSGDRFEKRKWKEFLYGSRLASALGIWPWCDVFMSSETPNILLATLSAGVVGIGDSADSENLQNIFRAVRSDGMIVKPDAPIIPVDRSYSDDLDGRGVRIAMTHTDWGTLLKTVYMFAYADSAVHDEVRVKAPEAGIDGKAYVYDYFSGTGAEIDSVTPFRILGGSEPWSYHIVAPITKSGVAFIGDTGKFVTCGKARIAKLVEIAGGIRGTVLLARGEGMVTLCGYSPRVVDIQAEGGTMSDRTYDSSAHLFRFGFRAKENLRYRMRDGEDVAEIQVTIRVR